MGFCQSVDRVQLFNLLTGMLGIYILYFISGLLHQSLIKRPHYNRFTNDYDLCENTSGLLLVPFLAAWVMGAIYNKFFLSQRVVIPHKNSAVAAVAVFAATYFSTLAIQRISFPVVVMFESCSILTVVIIGVFCSRVHDPNLKLGPKKIAVALIITAGILIFQFADPQTKEREVKQQFIGIVFLLFHFVAEGFLPDLQAEIKVNFKPQPTEMMADINKWCFIITLIICVCTLNAWPFIVFLWQHAQFTIELVAMSVTSGFGQFFVYRMIKQFKQHFVPFTISSRKILTVALSIVFFKHKTNWLQIIGICIVLFTIFVEFMTEISKPEEKFQTRDIVIDLNEQKIDDNIKNYSDQAQQKSQDRQNHSQDVKTMEKESNSYHVKLESQIENQWKSETEKTQKSSNIQSQNDQKQFQNENESKKTMKGKQQIFEEVGIRK